MGEPTETHGLLLAEIGKCKNSRDISRFRSYQIHHFGSVRYSPDYYRDPNCLPTTKCILTTILVVVALFILFLMNPFREWTPESRISLLDAETQNAGFVVPLGCRSYLVLMRHCEKADGDDSSDSSDTEDDRGDRHCSAIGLERAEYIKTLFGDGPKAIWALPTCLYAMGQGGRQGDHLNYREIETVTPLRDKAGVRIDTRFLVGDETKLVEDYFRWLASGEMCGRVAVVNWKHSRMPILAAAAGCGADEGCPVKYNKDEYDEVWQIAYTFGSEKGGKGRYLETKRERKGKQWSVKGDVIKEGFKPNYKR